MLFCRAALRSQSFLTDYRIKFLKWVCVSFLSNILICPGCWAPLGRKGGICGYEESWNKGFVFVRCYLSEGEFSKAAVLKYFLHCLTHEELYSPEEAKRAGDFQLHWAPSGSLGLIPHVPGAYLVEGKWEAWAPLYTVTVCLDITHWLGFSMRRNECYKSLNFREALKITWNNFVLLLVLDLW